MGGVPITTIVGQHGTPMYVYDGDMVCSRYEALKSAFPSFEIFYSMKANPSFALVGLLRHLGAGSEIASGGELFLTKEVGHDPLDVVFAGPGKTDRELEDAIISGVFAINIESLRELDRVAHIAKLIGIPARVALRINTAVGLSKSGGGSAGPLHERMAGGPSKFGIDEEKLDALADHWDKRAVEIVGIHIYTASQILDAEEVVENAKRAVAAAEHVERITREPVMTIDFGAGFGVPHYKEETPLDLPALGARVEEVFKPFSDRKDVRLILELGRYLVSECGVFVTRVIELKESRGERFVITDGGINQFVRPVLMKVEHEARVISRLCSPTPTVAKVSGPLCTPIDIMSEHIQVPEDISLDDLVGIFNAGAYGFSMSPQLFLSHPSPVEVLVLDGEIIEARKRGTYKDFLLKQNPLPGSV